LPGDFGIASHSFKYGWCCGEDFRKDDIATSSWASWNMANVARADTSTTIFSGRAIHPVIYSQ